MVLLVFVVATLTNDLIREKLGWDYSQTLEEGIRKTYNWITEQIKSSEKYIPFHHSV